MAKQPAAAAKRDQHPNAPREGQVSTTTSNLPSTEVVAKFREDLGRMQEQFAPMLPAHIPADRFARIVMNAVNREPKLLACTRKSLWNACMQAAEDGLLPDRREGAIVPFRLKDEGLTATWIPMVQGIRKKVRNSGMLSDFKQEVVYAGDIFEYMLGDEPRIYHKPSDQQRGKNITHVYSIATFKDGTKSREVMPLAQVLQVGRKSRAFEDGPWQDPVFFQEMAKKTVAKLHAKQLPSDRDLDRVLRRDDALYQFEKHGEREHERPTIAGGTKAALDFFGDGGQPAATGQTVAREQQKTDMPANAQGSPESGRPSEGGDDTSGTASANAGQPAQAGEQQTGGGKIDEARELPPEWPEGKKIATPDDYAAYFRGWLARESDPAKAKARFKQEQDLRLDYKDPEFPPPLLRELKAELEARVKELERR